MPGMAESPFSRIYPVPEGVVRDVGKLSQGMEKAADGTYNGYRFMSVCGVQNVQTFLEELRRGGCGKLFVELNACEGGCVNGPLISSNKRAAYRGRIEVETYAQAAGPAVPAAPTPALDWESFPRSSVRISRTRPLSAIFSLKSANRRRIKSSTAVPAVIRPAAIRRSRCIREIPRSA